MSTQDVSKTQGELSFSGCTFIYSWGEVISQVYILWEANEKGQREVGGRWIKGKTNVWETHGRRGYGAFVRILCERGRQKRKMKRNRRWWGKNFWEIWKGERVQRWMEKADEKRAIWWWFSTASQTTSGLTPLTHTHTDTHRHTKCIKSCRVQPEHMLQ